MILACGAELAAGPLWWLAAIVIHVVPLVIAFIWTRKKCGACEEHK